MKPHSLITMKMRTFPFFLFSLLHFLTVYRMCACAIRYALCIVQYDRDYCVMKFQSSIEFSSTRFPLSACTLFLGATHLKWHLIYFRPSLLHLSPLNIHFAPFNILMWVRKKWTYHLWYGDLLLCEKHADTWLAAVFRCLQCHVT